jgi:hypothetical protein
MSAFEVAVGATNIWNGWDAWYATTTGGATTITWSYEDNASAAVQPEFWVYELSGSSAWTLLGTGVEYGNLGTSPYLGPSLNGTASDNFYFTFLQTGDPGAMGGTVGSPWTLDPSEPQDNLSEVQLAYVLNSTGTQQVSLTTSDTPDYYVMPGFVFGVASGVLPGLQVEQASLVFEVSTALTNNLRVSQAALIIEVPPQTGLHVEQCYLIFEIGPLPTLVTLAGGEFQDPAGNPISYGYLIARLIVNGATSVKTKIPLGQDGNVLPGITIMPNDTGLSAGSFYQVNLHTATGELAWMTQHTMTVGSYPQTQNITGLIELSP